jgi:hypothetical protein
MKRLDEGDADDDHTSSGGSSRGGEKLAEKIAAIQGKRDRQKALLAELERTGAEQISLTDPDARAMARMTKIGVGYNIQLAVDVKHKLIAEQSAQDAQWPNALRIHRQDLDVRAGQVHRRSDPPDAGTKHLSGASAVS